MAAGVTRARPAEEVEGGAATDSCRGSASAAAARRCASAQTKNKASSASSSSPSPRRAGDLSIIVHPAFTHLCASPPELFCPLDWLPDEVISNVLVHLVLGNPYPQSGRDVARFSLVNHRARRLCADDELWRELCVRNFAIHPSSAPARESDGGTWRTLYEMHHEVLYGLFRSAGKSAMGGTGVRDALGAGLGAMSSGQLGNLSISLGA